MRAVIGFLLAAIATFHAPQVRRTAVTIDRETHVSQADASFKIGETVLAAHPRDPNRLIGAGVAWLNGAGRRAVVVYTSKDGGASWTRTLSTADTFYDAADEDVAFALDGTAYVIVLTNKTNHGRYDVALYRSENGGVTWTLTYQMRPGTSFDRPFLAARPDGTLYVTMLGAIRRADGEPVSVLAIFTSADRGRSLTFVGTQTLIPPAEQYFNGNIVLTSDGTAIVTYPEMDDGKVLDTKYPQRGSWLAPERVLGSVKTMRVTQEPRLEPFVTVAKALHPLRPAERSIPILAIDSTGARYNDRVYITWVDRRSGRARIVAAFSIDKGVTWSTPRAVDDVPDAAAAQQEPNNTMPSIAVNRDGVVAAAWYDRREDPANLGWRVRFAYSVDGGETWKPSVPVTSRPNVFDADGMWSTTIYGPVLELQVDDRQLNGSDTVGFTAAADGSFHGFWIDNRTGVPQIWTARVRVDGRATRNGSADLEELEDVSKDTLVLFDQASYRGGLIRGALTVKNTSQRTLSAPAKLRVIVAESVIGIPELVADNGETGVGAVWDLAPYFPDGRLEPGATSKPLAISCRLRSRKPIVEGLLERVGLLRLETKVLATTP